MNKEYQFNLLDETSVSEDLFEDQTHQKIASTLCNVIQKGDSEGITIGLEGGWGSGKSTVVSILKNQLKADRNTQYFYFDAWAHEGDPLRRVFLEALIDQIGDNDDKLQEIKSRISNRKKISKINTRQTVTTLGKCLGIAALFIPLGVALVSGTASKIGFQWNGDINWLFTLGLFFVLAPIFILIGNGIILLMHHKKLKDPDNWMFLQGESKSTITQEVSEDEERSSIEFEKYFCEIIDVIFSKNENTKLLIVVDNLDRVDPSDSLKIWSTLQTFLQRRNPIDKNSKYLRRIWVLVPYDEEGLEKLWKGPLSEHNNNFSDGSEIEKDSNDTNCAKSFFDKCFQLRIEVPRLIFTGWESFCKNNIDQALAGWTEDKKEEVLNVLKWTRKNVNDIPTPREIKTYINQVGLLRMHCDKEISTIAIAYFAIQKYIRFQKNSDIQKQLVVGTLPINKNKPLFPSDLPAELCGILFGVSAEKGQQLLLEPEIEKALTSKKTDKIKKLAEIHKGAFWTILNLHLSNMMDLNRIRSYSFNVWNGLWELYPDNCIEFIDYLKVSVGALKSLEFPEQDDLADYVAIFSLLDVGKYDFSDIWEFIIQSLSEKMNKNDFDYSEGNQILSKLASCQKHKVPSRFTLKDVPFENWIKWASASNTAKINSYDLVKPQDSIFNEIASRIKAGKPIPDSLYDLIEYLVYAGETTWEQIIDTIRSYIEWNEGTPSGDILTIELLKILTLLSRNGQTEQKPLEQIINMGQFYNLVYHLNSQGSVRYAALLLAKYFPENIGSIQIPNVANSMQGLKLVRDFWKTKNDDNAQFIWDEIRSSSDFEFIWKLARDENNELVGDIIKIAAKENCKEFFDQEDALQLFEAAIIITGDEYEFNDKLANCFITHSSIEKEIAENKNLDIIKFSKELYLLVENSENIIVASHLIDKINDLKKEHWDSALQSDTYLTTLVLTIHEKMSGLHLGDDLYESLLQYLQKWISNKVKPSEPQEDELPEMISMLKKNFNSQLKDRLADYIIEISFKGSSKAVSALNKHINIKKLISENKSKIQNVVDDSSRNSEIETLKVLDIILSHPDSSSFKPDKRLSEVLKSPMKKIHNSSQENQDMIERLAKKFGVDLTELQSNIIEDSAKEP